MMLHLHSGPCQLCLSVSQHSEEETLAFEFESADVWKSADIHYLNRDRQGWRGRLKHAAEVCDTSNQCTHLCECYLRGKKKRRGEEMADGSCGEKIKNSTMSRRKGWKNIFPHFNSGCDVLSNTWPRCLLLKHFSINVQLKNLLPSMNKTSDKQSFLATVSYQLKGQCIDHLAVRVDVCEWIIKADGSFLHMKVPGVNSTCSPV